MKTFKDLRVAFLSLMACWGLTACSSDENPPLVNEEPDSDVYVVQLGMGGELLEVNYEPLSRTAPTGVYAINVFSAPNKELGEGENVAWEHYAYGLFDNEDNMTIRLIKGYKYKFEATLVRDAKEKLQSHSSSNGIYFYGPFSLNDGTSYLTNTFDYQYSIYFSYLGSGNSFLKEPNGIYSYPNTERFYGELEGYVPGKNNDKAKIQMKRTSFGAKFKIQGRLATSGTMEIQMVDAPKIMIQLNGNNNQYSDIFTFKNVRACWAENGNYTESVKATFNWHQADGKVFPLNTHELTFKRNATTVITIKIDNENAEDNLGIFFDESELGEMPEDGENDTTIEDGEIVDTEIDTNQPV